jgi:hypothetical protein
LINCFGQDVFAGFVLPSQLGVLKQKKEKIEAWRGKIKHM